MDPAPSGQFLSQFPPPSQQQHLNIAPSVQKSPSTTSPTVDTQVPQMTPTSTALPEDKKRLTACLVCRKRKLKCDSARPKCGSCARLGHACGYEETRKKSGPKQGYVKKLEQKSQTLEQRLAQLEKLLATHQTQQSTSPSSGSHLPTPPGISPLPFETLSAPASAAPAALNQFSFQSNSSSDANIAHNMFSTQPVFPDLSRHDSNDINLNAFPLFANDTNTQSANGNSMNNQWAWDLVSLGITEELPPEDVTNRLVDTYFEKAHPMLPFLHRGRFVSQLQLPPNIGVPVCLRYAVWALGASVSTDATLRSYKDIFYTRARRSLTDLLETTLDSLKPHRISTLQTLVLLSYFEFIHAIFGHAWMNCGRASRMAVYFNLLRLDEPHLFCKQTLSDPRDWVDQEERRRTFWAAFILDKFASLGTGWAATLHEDDITTFLPGSDDEYQAGIGVISENTGESLYPSSKSSGNRNKIGALAAIARITAFLGRLNLHVNRPHHDKDYLTRHRDLDNLLATIQFSIPQHLKYVPGSMNMQAAFLQNLLSVSSVLLNQAALYKSQLTELPLRLSDLASRCHMGALEVAATIRGTANVHVTMQCAYTSFCIYVGARVFVEMLRQPTPPSPPANGPSRESLQSDLTMMLAALQSFTEHVPLAGHFLMQLEADLNGLEKVISIRPYDVSVGYGECHIFNNIAATESKGSEKTTPSGTTPPMMNPQMPNNDWMSTPHVPFDVRGVDRLSYMSSRSNSLNATTPTGQSTSSATGSASIQALSSDSSPNTETPDAIRQFDPDKFFGDMNLSGTGIDVSMNLGQGMGDDGVEFFTEMLGVHLNNGN